MKNDKKIIFIVLILALVIVGIIVTINYRINNNLVLFCTWEKKYPQLIKNVEYTSTGTAEYLFSLKKSYIGGLPEVVVGRLLDELDIRAYGHYTFKLKYTNKPYALVINYSVIEGWGNILNNPQTVIEKSAILLALNDNIDEIHWILPNSNEVHKVTRNDLLAEYGTIKDYGKSVDNFKQLLIKLGYYKESEPITISINTLTNTGGPVGVESISSSIGEEVITIEDVIEPFLLQEGYIKRTSRGRQVTDKTYKYLNIEVNEQTNLF